MEFQVEVAGEFTASWGSPVAGCNSQPTAPADAYDAAFATTTPADTYARIQTPP